MEWVKARSCFQNRDALVQGRKCRRFRQPSNEVIWRATQAPKFRPLIEKHLRGHTSNLGILGMRVKEVAEGCAV